MTVEYRGFNICPVEADLPTIELVEVATGARLPTKIVGGPQESLNDLAARARRLCDMYAAERPRVRTS